MLCFPQVATQTQITAEQYLRMTFEHDAEFMQTLEEYLTWGVSNIGVVDPATRRFSVHNHWSLQNVSSYSLPNYSFQLTPSDLLSDL